MSMVRLKILEPSNKDTFFFPPTEEKVQTLKVMLSVEICSADHRPETLYIKWYSSIDGELGSVVLIDTDFPSPANIKVPLHVGSHIITVTAKDKNDIGVPEKELLNLYKNVKHIGMGGGSTLFKPEEVPNPCLVHIFIANMLVSLELRKSESILEAQAPIQWCSYPDYQKDDQEYHKVNHIKYRWFFQRGDQPSGPKIELELKPGDLKLIPATTDKPFTVIRYTGKLPDSLETDQLYTIFLRVEDKDHSNIGHQISQSVIIRS